MPAIGREDSCISGAALLQFGDPMPRRWSGAPRKGTTPPLTARSAIYLRVEHDAVTLDLAQP